MAHQPSITYIKERIAKAIADSEVWRVAGSSEKYLEACSHIAELEADLAGFVKARGGAGAPETLHVSAEPVTSAPTVSTIAGRAQTMADLSIAYDGLRYYHDKYRYDRLEDAVDYARLRRSRVGSQARTPMPKPLQHEPPDDRDRHTMMSFGIKYAQGAYLLGEHRYERLADAVAYARLLWGPVPGDGQFVPAAQSETSSPRT